VLSDTHCAELISRDGDGDGGDYVEGRAFREPLPSADVVVHCGKWKFSYVDLVACLVLSESWDSFPVFALLRFPFLAMRFCLLCVANFCADTIHLRQGTMRRLDILSKP